MKTLNRIAMAAAVTAFAPVAAVAQQMTVTGGVALTSNYISDGLTQSDDNPALQGYVELESGMFYAGVWASTVDGFGDNAEFDLYVGLRGEFGPGISYDIGYYRYIYDNSGNCCGEIILSMGIPLTPSITMTPQLAYDPETEVADYSFAFDVAVNDRIGLSALAGVVDESHRYYKVGASYALNDSTYLDLSWHDTNIDKGRAVLSLNYDFTLFSR